MTLRPHRTDRRIVGPDHAVDTVIGGDFHYRKEPCAECPWRTDLPTGVFPADAYRATADTAYDMATRHFGCHIAGGHKPQTCAGYLMRGAVHNLNYRLKVIDGKIDPASLKSPFPLYDSYRAMAEANGVPADDPALLPCRGIDS